MSGTQSQFSWAFGKGRKFFRTISLYVQYTLPLSMRSITTCQKLFAHHRVLIWIHGVFCRHWFLRGVCTHRWLRVPKTDVSHAPKKCTSIRFEQFGAAVMILWVMIVELWVDAQFVRGRAQIRTQSFGYLFIYSLVCVCESRRMLTNQK